MLRGVCEERWSPRARAFVHGPGIRWIGCPLRGASQSRYTWYLAHTPRVTPTGPLKPLNSSPIVRLPAGFLTPKNKWCYCWRHWHQCCLFSALWSFVFFSLSTLNHHILYVGSALLSVYYLCLTFEVLPSAHRCLSCIALISFRSLRIHRYCQF